MMKPRTTTHEILLSVMHERMAQDQKWGPQQRSFVEWISILAEEVGEAATKANHYHFDQENVGRHLPDLRKELIQCAAVCVAIVEQIDNGEARVIA